MPSAYEHPNSSGKKQVYLKGSYSFVVQWVKNGPCGKTLEKSQCSNDHSGTKTPRCLYAVVDMLAVLLISVVRCGKHQIPIIAQATSQSN